MMTTKSEFLFEKCAIGSECFFIVARVWLVTNSVPVLFSPCDYCRIEGAHDIGLYTFIFCHKKRPSSFLFLVYPYFRRLLSSGYLMHFPLLLVMYKLGFSYDNLVEDFFSSPDICRDLLVQTQQHRVLGPFMNLPDIDSYPWFFYFSKSKHDRSFFKHSRQRWLLGTTDLPLRRTS